MQQAHQHSLREEETNCEQESGVFISIACHTHDRMPVPMVSHCNDPLSIKSPSLPPRTSEEWLKKNGLKAKGLDLYEVLAKNSYPVLTQFVPILGKTVTSKVHERAMVQFEWHDGSVRNVHVDLPLLHCYQDRLLKAMNRLEERVLWLSTGSRQIWGTLCEPRVLVLVDVCQPNAQFLARIQHSLRLLLEEQLADKESFNLIAFGSDVKLWNSEMVPPTVENLQDAWHWVQGLQCSGCQTVFKALRHAIENLHHRAPLQPLSLYLFTSEAPDQDMPALVDYVKEQCSSGNLKLHVCAFSRGNDAFGLSDPPYFAHALRSLAHAGQGQFHWHRDTGFVESSDMAVLLQQTEKAASFLQKSSLLMDSLSQKAQTGHPTPKRPQSAPSLPSHGQREKLLAPRPTALTLARLEANARRQEEHMGSRASIWSPNGAKSAASPVSAQPQNTWEQSKVVNKQKKPEVTFSVFYTGAANSLGIVFKTYPKAKNVRKPVPCISLPKKEEVCSTKQWLKRFGVKQLKLDLYKLAAGPECTHSKKTVPTGQESSSNQYCAIFPSVPVNGVVKHVQMTSGELAQYMKQTEKLLKRYTQRMLWLLSGSRCVFGSVLERDVCVLLDMSGSMAPYLDDVKKGLESLIWEQFYQKGVRFTLLSFANVVKAWNYSLVEASEEECRDAVQWVSQLCAYGGTCVTEALQAVSGFGISLGCYLVSDGKPNSSCSLVLEDLERMIVGKHITIHTISFLCSDGTANEFLKKLARRTGGRFHCYSGDTDVQTAKSLLQEPNSNQDGLALPAFEGDDLRKLAREMDKVRQYQTQAKMFREIILQKTHPQTQIQNSNPIAL